MEQKFNAKKLIFIFFILIGTLHILTGLMASNEYFLPLSSLINKVLDIPFAMIALFYAFTSVDFQKKPEHRKIYYLLMGICSILIFAGLIYINVFLPDRIV